MPDKTPQATVLSKNPIAFAGEHAGMEKFFKLEHWRVKVDDREDDRILWKRGGFVLVVARDCEGRVVMIREYKQAAEKVLVCLPAGTIKKGENPIGAAARELKEETGYLADPSNCFVSRPYLNSPDKSTEFHHVVFFPDVLPGGDSSPEESETIIGVELCRWEDAKEKTEIGMHRMAIEVAEDWLLTR